MNRNLLVLALSAVALPAHSMTASVTTAQQPPNTASVPVGATAAKSAATASAAATGAAAGKIVMPSAVTATQPAAVLSAPGVAPRGNLATAARAGSAKSTAKPFMPGGGAQDDTVRSPPAKLASAAIANDSAGMRRGTLEGVNASAGTFSVYGQKLNFNAQKVRVFNRDGKPGSAFNLKAGAKIRFTLDATDPLRRRVAVIYVD